MPFVGLADLRSRVANQYFQAFNLLKLGLMPALFIIDRQGQICFSHLQRLNERYSSERKGSFYSRFPHITNAAGYHFYKVVSGFSVAGYAATLNPLTLLINIYKTGGCSAAGFVYVLTFA
jgi:hypothetical protein